MTSTADQCLQRGTSNMKIDRLACIAQIDDLIAQDFARHEQNEDARGEEYDTAVKVWRKDKSKALASTLRELATKASKGGLVTEFEVSEATGNTYQSRRSGEVLTWDGGEAPKPREYHQPEKLIRLRAVLAASPDECITTSALRDFGFSPAIFIKGVNA